MITKFFLITRTIFFFTVGQNNFGNKTPFFYCRSLRSTSGSSEDLRSETTTKPDAISLDLAASVIEDDPFEDQEGHAGQPQYSEAEGYFFILANSLPS